MCNMKEVKKLFCLPEQVSKEEETLKCLVMYEESLGDSPFDHLMKVILNRNSLRTELIRRIMRKS